jgi:ferric-dicitrate binding protein FerR (iron transport regulator)
MSPKHYAEFELEDFILDDWFVQWVKSPTPEGTDFWENWLREHPARGSVVEEARQLVLHLNAGRHSMPAESFRRIQVHLDNVYASLAAEETLARARPGKRREPLRWRWPVGVAAAVSLLLLVGAAWYFANRESGARSYTTAYGQTRPVTLPDGSEVLMNANSRLRVPAAWSANGPREVWLEGEAFFKVARKMNAAPANTSSRFVVHTGQVDVEVLGTRFNVTNRRGQTTVILNEGKVKLEEGALSGGREVIMAPGEYVQLGSDARTLVRKTVNPSQYSSWTENRYVFDDTSLREIAQIIEDTYGVEVKFGNHRLAARTFSATIPTKNLDVLLLALSESFGMEIEKDGNQLVFK